MKVHNGYARLEIPETENDSRRLRNAEAVLVIAQGEGKALRFAFYGGNGGAYGVDIVRSEVELPNVE